MKTNVSAETLTPAQKVERNQERQEKKVFFMILLGFLSVSSGVMIYFGARALTGLASRPNASLGEGVASVGAMLFGDSEDADEAAEKLTKPNPFEEPKAFFNDTSGAASTGSGALSSGGGAGSLPSGAGKGGVPFSGPSDKTAAAGKLGGALSGIGAAGSGSKSVGALSGGSSSSKNGSGFNIGTPGNRGGLDEKAQGRGTLSALKNAANTLYKSALGGSAQDKRAAGALVYDGADKSRSGAEAQFSGAMVKLDSVNSSATDLKDHNPGSLSVPEVGKPVSDMDATKKALDSAVKDALKKAMDSTSGGVNAAYSAQAQGLSDTVQNTKPASETGSKPGVYQRSDAEDPLKNFRYNGKDEPAIKTCEGTTCTYTFVSDGFQLKEVDGKPVSIVQPGENGTSTTVNLINGQLPSNWSYADGTTGAKK